MAHSLEVDGAWQFRMFLHSLKQGYQAALAKLQEVNSQLSFLRSSGADVSNRPGLEACQNFK